MFPDKETKCHRTGFEKTCHEIVSQCNCRLWRHFTGKDPQSGAEMDVWDCVEGMQLKFWIENARTNLMIAASVDKLVNTVVAANDSGMASALMGINAQIKRVADVNEAQVNQFITEAPARQLIGSD